MDKKIYNHDIQRKKHDRSKLQPCTLLLIFNFLVLDMAGFLIVFDILYTES